MEYIKEGQVMTALDYDTFTFVVYLEGLRPSHDGRYFTTSELESITANSKTKAEFHHPGYVGIVKSFPYLSYTAVGEDKMCGYVQEVHMTKRGFVDFSSSFVERVVIKLGRSPSELGKNIQPIVDEAVSKAEALHPGYRGAPVYPDEVVYDLAHHLYSVTYPILMTLDTRNEEQKENAKNLSRKFLEGVVT